MCRWHRHPKALKAAQKAFAYFEISVFSLISKNICLLSGSGFPSLQLAKTSRSNVRLVSPSPLWFRTDDGWQNEQIRDRMSGPGQKCDGDFIYRLIQLKMTSWCRFSHPGNGFNQGNWTSLSLFSKHFIWPTWLINCDAICKLVTFLLWVVSLSFPVKPDAQALPYTCALCFAFAL